MISAEVHRAVKKLELRTLRALAGVWSGLSPSRMRGAGLAFEEIRPYVPGDDIRDIDWKVTARTGHAFVKRYAEERERSLWLVVDQSASMDLASGGRSKRDAAIDMAAVFLFHAAHHRDRLGMLQLPGTGTVFHPARRGVPHARRLLANLLAGKHSQSAMPQDLDPGILRFRHAARQRSLVIVLGDFLDSTLVDLACGLRGRHEVLAIQVIDPWERSLPAEGLVRFRDLENGQIQLVDTSSERYRAAFIEQAKIRERTLRQRFAKHAIRWIPIVTDRSAVVSLIEKLGK